MFVPLFTVAVVPSNVSALPLVATLEPLRYRTPLAVPPSNTGLLLNVCTPVKVCAASVLAAVKFASGSVIVRAAVGPEKVKVCVATGIVVLAAGKVTV